MNKLVTPVDIAPRPRRPLEGVDERACLGSGATFLVEERRDQQAARRARRSFNPVYDSNPLEPAARSHRLTPYE